MHIMDDIPIFWCIFLFSIPPKRDALEGFVERGRHGRITFKEHGSLL